MSEANTNKNQSEWKSLIIVGLIALSIRIFLIEPFFVPTGSMKETILEQEYIFSTKFSYGYSKYSIPFSPDLFSGRLLASEPHRGDIVIFRPTHRMHDRFIKRLIGLPGDKIQIINNVININDKPVEREDLGLFTGDDNTIYRRYKEILPNGFSFIAYEMENAENTYFVNQVSNTDAFYVPAHNYFFIGDNRFNSDDSRSSLGFVPFENFIAKAQFRFFSTKELLWSKDGSILDPIFRLGIWLKSIRFERLFTSVYH